MYFSYPTFTVEIRSTSMTIPNSNCDNQISIGDFITVMVIDISLDLYFYDPKSKFDKIPPNADKGNRIKYYT